MFEAIKYRWKLRKLEKECNRITEPYDKRRKGLSIQELEDLRSEIGSELALVSEKINALKTSRFRQIANRLMVPLPESKDKELWEDLYYIGGRTLTDKGFWKLKKLIRKEKRERREGFRFWLVAFTGVIGFITGVIGMITALVAIIKR